MVQEEPYGPLRSTRLCIVTAYPPTLSETFIRAHVERLPADILLVHGWRPSVGDRTVLSWRHIAFHKAARTLLRTGLKREVTTAYLKAFRQHHTEVVLAEYGDIGVQVMEACRHARIPLVVHFHGYDASKRDILQQHADTYPRMFAYASAIVVVSRAMQRQIVALGAPREKVSCNPYGVDCGKFGQTDPASVPPIFIAVGRFTEKKAPQLTLLGFAKVLREFPEARLSMIGDGPLLPECRVLATRLGVRDAVRFLGAQPHEVVREELRRARAFVQHSVVADSGDSEGTPVAIIEAGAAGLPVVATRHAGIPDVVVEEETGLLVEERDVCGMAANMARFAREPELARRMGRAARRRVETYFSMERSLANLWSIIESCLRRTTFPLRRTERATMRAVDH